MSRNGAGVYSLPTGNPVITNTTISSTWCNNTLSDIASALTQSIAKDGQTTATANLPMGGFKLTNLGNGSAATDSLNLGQAQSSSSQMLSAVSGTNTITASLNPTLTAYANGQTFRFVAAASNTGAVTININGLGAKSITKDGTSTLVTGDILINALYEISYDGTQFQLVNSSFVNTFTGGTVTSDITMSSATDKWSKGADVASATALPLITDGNYFDVTGTTTITSFNSVGVGTWVRLHFDAALTLTHNATDLILPGGANITTAANDEAEFIEYASGDYRCVSYTRANGNSVVGGITSGTAINTTSGTSHDYTSIPSTVKRITLMLAGVSTNGTSAPLVQIGDSGGIENTGYSSASSQVTGTAASTTFTTGFGINSAGAANVMHGSIVLNLLDSSSNTWTCSFSLGYSNTSGTIIGGGSKSLSATLDRIRLTTVNGTDTYDAGTINIIYE